MQVLRRMVADSALDPGIVSALELHYDEINDIRSAAQSQAFSEHKELFLKLR